MIPSTHKVYRLTGKSIDQLKQFTEDVPKPKPNEVLIQTKAVSLNSRDLQVVLGRYPVGAKDRVTPCSDLSGVVVAVGELVSDHKVGDKVISNFNGKEVYSISKGLLYGLGAGIDGTLAEYVSLPQEAVNPMPDRPDFSWEAASSLVCAGVTAWNALYGLRKLVPGDYVLALGTGGVSLIALSIAKKAGAITIVTSSSDEKLAKMKSLGVDYTINYKTHPEWETKVLEYTRGNGADFVIENGGIGTIKKSISSTAAEGVITLIGFVAPRPQKNPDVFTAAMMRGVVLRGVRVGPKNMALDLIKFVENRGLDIAIDRTFSADKAQEAFKLLESGQHVGKICIKFGDSQAKL